MKRLLSLLLAADLLLSLASCNEADESRKDFQNYDELEHKSDDLYSDDEVLTYSHKDGTFALTPEGKWAYMDHTMLGQMMEGVVVMQSDKDYDVIVCSAIVDDSETITQITVLYGEINQIMAILNA
ncbi:MAG: hypothetical protein E7647_08695 [Ruminococcaceae bacterium]|nr:hypothetical protein [Oscillospiraceae bacterium]